MADAPAASIRKEALRVTLSQGHQVHLLRLYAPALTLHAQLLVLPGLGNDSSVWLSGEHPWVRAMAQAGWDVYVADTRGKGYSLPRISPQSDWGLQALLDEEIPALIKCMRNDHAALPWVCVAEDALGLGLLTAFASRRVATAHLQGMVLLQVGRLDAQPDWHYRGLWCLGRGITRLAGYVRSPWLPGPAVESRRRFFGMLDWLRAPEWCDMDGAALKPLMQGVSLPGILHVAQQSHWLPAANVQQFVRDLPAHDARVLHCDASDVDAWRQSVEGDLASLVMDWISRIAQALPEASLIKEGSGHDGW